MDLTVWLTLSGQKGDSSKGSKQIKGQGCAHIWDKYHKKRQKKYKKKDKKETNFTKRDKTKRQKGCFSKTAKAAKRLKRGQGYTHVWDKYNKKREEKKTKSRGVLETAKAANRQKGKAVLMFWGQSWPWGECVRIEHATAIQKIDAKDNIALQKIMNQKNM